MGASCCCANQTGPVPVARRQRVGNQYILRNKLRTDTTAILRPSLYNGAPIVSQAGSFDVDDEPRVGTLNQLEGRINECSTLSHGVPQFEEFRLFEQDTVALHIKAEGILLH